MLGEFIVAVPVTQMDVFHRLLGTVDINMQQFGWALMPAIALLVLWEIGKVTIVCGRCSPDPPPITRRWVIRRAQVDASIV